MGAFPPPLNLRAAGHAECHAGSVHSAWGAGSAAGTWVDPGGCLQGNKGPTASRQQEPGPRVCERAGDGRTPCASGVGWLAERGPPVGLGRGSPWCLGGPGRGCPVSFWVRMRCWLRVLPSASLPLPRPAPAAGATSLLTFPPPVDSQVGTQTGAGLLLQPVRSKPWRGGTHVALRPSHNPGPVVPPDCLAGLPWALTLVRWSFPPEPLVQMIRCLEKRKHCRSPSFFSDRDPRRPLVILPFSDMGTWMREPMGGGGRP